MSRWFRVYEGVVDDPKVQRLSADLFRCLINLWCLASSNGGFLPPLADIAFKLRLKPGHVKRMIDELVRCELIDETDDGLVPHNWDGRQYKSDVSTERVKRFRKRKRNVSSDVSETPPETDTESEIDKTARSAASAVKSEPDKPYAFEGGIIRLTEKHWNDWTIAFAALDLRAELVARDAWLGSERATNADRKNWFISTSKYLANRNMEAKSKVQALRPEPQRGIAGII